MSARTALRVNNIYGIYRAVQAGIGVGIAYVGSQGRNLFLRSIANRTVGVQTNGASAATQVREFDILSCADGTVRNGTVTPLTSVASSRKLRATPLPTFTILSPGGRITGDSRQPCTLRG